MIDTTEDLQRHQKLTAQLQRAVEKRQLDGWTPRYTDMDSFTSGEYRWGMNVGRPVIYVNDDATGYTVFLFDFHGQKLREPVERKSAATAMKLAERWANGEEKTPC